MFRDTLLPTPNLKSDYGTVVNHVLIANTYVISSICCKSFFFALQPRPSKSWSKTKFNCHKACGRCPMKDGLVRGGRRGSGSDPLLPPPAPKPYFVSRFGEEMECEPLKRVVRFGQGSDKMSHEVPVQTLKYRKPKTLNPKSLTGDNFP